MALVTSHVLNSVDGTHAADVAVVLYRLDSQGSRSQVLEVVTGEDGRFAEEVNVAPGRYEMVFQSGEYFSVRADSAAVSEVVIRFIITDTNGHYHIPLMLSPHSYAVWWSVC